MLSKAQTRLLELGLLELGEAARLLRSALEQESEVTAMAAVLVARAAERAITAAVWAEDWPEQ